MIWSWDYLALWGILDAWHSVLEASQSCDKLTFGLTNMYYKWAIKLFGNYKKSMLNVLEVWWKVYDKVIYSPFKDKVIDLYLCSLLCPFIII